MQLNELFTKEEAKEEHRKRLKEFGIDPDKLEEVMRDHHDFMITYTYIIQQIVNMSNNQNEAVKNVGIVTGMLMATCMTLGIDPLKK